MNLNDFLQTLKNQTNQGRFYLSGLIVRESENAPNLQDLASVLPKFHYFQVDSDTTAEFLIEQLNVAFQQNIWMCIHINDNKPPEVFIETLKRLRDSNSVFIQTKNGKENYFATQTEEMRCIVVIDKNILDEIEDFDFQSLFGVIIDV